jgi:hypothetical protein
MCADRFMRVQIQKPRKTLPQTSANAVWTTFQRTDGFAKLKGFCTQDDPFHSAIPRKCGPQQAQKSSAFRPFARFRLFSFRKTPIGSAARTTGLQLLNV